MSSRWSAYFGALKVGAAFSGINVLFREAEIAAQLAHLEPAVVVAGPEFVPLVDRVREQVAVPNWFVLGDAPDGWESVPELLAAGDPGEPDCDVSRDGPGAGRLHVRHGGGAQGRA